MKTLLILGLAGVLTVAACSDDAATSAGSGAPGAGSTSDGGAGTGVDGGGVGGAASDAGDPFGNYLRP